MNGIQVTLFFVSDFSVSVIFFTNIDVITFLVEKNRVVLQQIYKVVSVEMQSC